MHHGFKPLPLHARSVDRETTGARDMEDSAEIVRGLEKLITVDTALAHVAGAMGKPCWLLLPYKGDWRWLTGRTDSPWYPSIRIFRQPAPGDWASDDGRVMKFPAVHS